VTASPTQRARVGPIDPPRLDKPKGRPPPAFEGRDGNTHWVARQDRAAEDPVITRCYNYKGSACGCQSRASVIVRSSLLAPNSTPKTQIQHACTCANAGKNSGRELPSGGARNRKLATCDLCRLGENGVQQHRTAGQRPGAPESR